MNPDGPDSDGEGGGGPGGPRQTEEERMVLRRRLRAIGETLNRQEEALVEPGETDRLEQILDEAKEEFQKVQLPREGVIQSKCVAMFATLAKRKAQNLNTEFVQFNPGEFCDKLLSFAHDAVRPDLDGTLSRDGWNFIGENVQHCFRRAAPLKCMFGTFERGEVFTGKQRRARVPREKDKVTEADNTKLKEVKQGELNTLETTTKEVEEKVLPKLIEIYESVGSKPICYFEFVTNPQSYAHTIENIFHVSFLIKSGHAEMFLDEDRLPVIQPVMDIEEENAASNEPMTQMIQSLSYQEWQDIVQTFAIEEPMLEAN